MSHLTPRILALDFDGVICDGLIEYFETAWSTYCQIWSPLDQKVKPTLAPRFYRLRPVIETGWEMPVLIHALQQGISETEILQNWHSVQQEILQKEGLNSKEIGSKLDCFRDDWIERNSQEWLSLHRFYPGVIDRLQTFINSPIQPMIITTKEGRFVQQLLAQAGLKFPQKWIIGKESKKPKYEVLRELLKTWGETTSIWLIEDRLNTLLLVRDQPDLESIQLFLADWGYNTERERQSVQQHQTIHLLSLFQFSQDFCQWMT